MTDIGVYHPVHPLNILPAGRVEALVQAAQQQHIQLLFFDEDGIDLDKRTVQAMIPDPEQEGNWLLRSCPLPEIVMNEMARLPAERSPAEQRLNRLVTFTSHPIHAKQKVQHMLSELPQWSDWIVPTTVCTGIDSVLQLLEQQRDLILKPDQGRQGQHIVRVRLTDNDRYSWQTGNTSLILELDGLRRLAEPLLERQTYLMQPYIQSITEDGRPFDFRIHVQRGHEGTLQLTRLYVRYGEPGAVTSNLEQGGATAEWTQWIKQQHPQHADDYIARLPDIGLQLAHDIDSFYDYPLDELGIDLALDRQGKWWFYEANTAPQTREHERERAEHAVAYAAYVSQRHRLLDSLPKLSTDHQVIGLLSLQQADDTEYLFIEACSAVARLHDAVLVRIYASDIFYPQQRVLGYVWEYSRWVAYDCPYPDVLFDRLKKRGIAAYSRMYAELAHIPATHELKSGSMSKMHIYRLLQKAPESLQSLLIPFHESVHPKHIIQFIQKHQYTVLKPDTGSHGQHIFNIRQLDDGGYEVYDQSYLHQLDTQQLQQFVSMTIGQGYILQRFVNSSTVQDYPFHLRTHVMKIADGQWDVAFVQPYVAVSAYRKVTNHEQTLRVATKWDWFLNLEYGEKQGGTMDQRIRELAIGVAAYLEPLLKRRFPEVAIDIGIDRERNIWLFEANFNRIGNSFHAFEVAKYAVPYALSLIPLQ
ncbi:YheC/YheD family protein [Paenibacillus kandeliae]|uniref:YheC/YheD family protein n=1 Tax=Paenibacillus kandeliae TaxID=3231269 RepID=UPI0034580B24